MRCDAVRVCFTLLCAAQSIPGQDYEQLFRDATILSAKGDYAGAAQNYEAALRIRPNAPEALSNAGVVYYMAGRYEDALSVTDKALRARPDLLPANVIRGLSFVRLGRFADAAEPLERALRRDTTNRDAVLGLASAKVGLGRFEEAAALYREQTERAPRDADAWHGLALSLERAAEAQSRKLSSVAGGGAYAKRFLGEYWLERGQNKLAEEAFAEAAALDPEQPGVQALLAGAMNGRSPDHVDGPAATTHAAAMYLEARRLAGLSREAFEQFVDVAPDSWQAQLFMGDISRQRHEFQQAISHYEAAARLKPDSPAPLIGIGTVYWELAQDEPAIANLEKARKLAPHNVQVLFALGNIAVKQRRDADAIAVLRECLKAAPDHNGAHADIGKAYLHAGDAERAAEHLRRALDIDTYGDIHFQLGQSLRKLGREDEARKMMNQSGLIRQRQLEREQKLRLGRN